MKLRNRGEERGERGEGRGERGEGIGDRRNISIIFNSRHIIIRDFLLQNKVLRIY